MKKVIIVAPQFPPCNLAAVHRSRYFAAHLPKYGWDPIVITVEPAYYEEKTDPELAALLDSKLRVVRTKALPVKPVRLCGDIGVRSLWWHYRAMQSIIQKEKIEFVYIPIPPNYSAILGELIFRKYTIPYGIDYIDPWILPKPAAYKTFSKAWCAYRIGKFLEPRALRHVSLITGVSRRSFEDVYKRYQWLGAVPSVALPYGAEESDFRYLDTHPRPPFLFNPGDGRYHFVYAGTMWPQAYDTFEALFQALGLMRNRYPEVFAKIQVHFIGTGNDPRNAASSQMSERIKRYALETSVTEHPGRIPFLEVLNHLKFSHAVFVLGSGDAHYTPSKIFQAVLSGKPVIAVLHSQSSGVEILRQSKAGTIIVFDAQKSVHTIAEELCDSIAQTVRTPYDPQAIDWDGFYRYSAEACTQKLAAAFDAVLEKGSGRE